MRAGTTASWYTVFRRGASVGALGRSAFLPSAAGLAAFASLAAFLGAACASCDGGFLSFAGFCSLSLDAIVSSPGSDVHDFVVGLEEADLARRFLALCGEELEADAVALACGGVHQHHVGEADGHLLVDDAAGEALHGVGTLVLLHTVHAFDHGLAGLEDA